MSNIKSPFYIVPEFISPKKCDEILDNITTRPNENASGRPMMIERSHDAVEADIFSKFQGLIPDLEQYYDCKYRGAEQMRFQMLPENPQDTAIAPGCMNSKYLRKKWVKTADVDLTCLLWLKDYQDSVPLDPRTEVYGGKLEFPLYKFSFVPKRGTLLVYPAGPHFISVTSPVLVSDSYQVRFDLSIRDKQDSMFIYQPSNFPWSKSKGIIESWFSDHLA